MEVHGSCYSVMQMISSTSAQKLNCPAVEITQNSFDLDQFTYYVANHICEKHEKKYGVFYDWACEFIGICKYSGIATCVLAVHFTATDKQVVVPSTTTMLGGSGGRVTGAAVVPKKSSFFGEISVDMQPPVHLLKSDSSGEMGNYDCINCSSNLDCVFHRKHYHCCSLFTWDVVTGEWNVLDYGELVEMGQKLRNQSTKKQTAILRARAKRMADQLRDSSDGKGDEVVNETSQQHHIRVWDSCNTKSKNALTDLRNCIEFYRGPVPYSGLDELPNFWENNSSDEGEEEEEENEEFEDDEEDEDVDEQQIMDRADGEEEDNE